MRTPEPASATRDMSDYHAPQLITIEQTTLSAYSFLNEKNRPPRIQPDQQGQHRQQPAQDTKDNQDRYRYIEKPFHPLMNAACRLPVARATDAFTAAFYFYGT